MTGQPAAAVQLVAPSHSDVASRATVWPGGVSVIGPMVVIPGRTVSDIRNAEAHAAAILSACALAATNQAAGG